MTENTPARLGLPLFLGVLLVAALHGPLLRSGPLLEERALLESPSGVQGWVPGVLFTRMELQSLQPQAHRAVGLLLEVLLVVCAAMLLRRQGMFLIAAVALPLVYVLHPAHTETSLLLSSRPLLVSEVLLVGGALGLTAARPLARGLALVALAAGAVAMPAALALSLPFLWVGGAKGRSRRVGAVLALWVGFLAGMLGRPMSGSPWEGLAGLQVWWQPGSLGLVLDSEGGGWVAALAFLAMAVLLRLLAPATARRSVDLALLGALLVLLAGPVTRPVRLDLGRVGTELSPDVFLPFLAACLILFQVATQAAVGRRRLLPLALLILLAPGWWQANQFRDEEQLLEAAARAHPGSPSVHLARCESLLREVPVLAEHLRYDPALRALQEADQAIRLGAGRRARSARCLALAWLGKAAEAREAWSLLQEQHGGTAALLLLRGEVEFALQDPWEALRWFRDARDRTDGPGPAQRAAAVVDQLHGQIEAALRGGTPEESRALCDRLLSAAPDDQRAWEARAATFLLEDRFEDAAEAFQAILEFAPDSPVALMGMIQALEGMGRADAAIPYRQHLQNLGGLREFQ